MKRQVIFLLIAFFTCPFSLQAQEPSFFAGQIENTFNYHFDLGEDLSDYSVDLNADGVNDLHFEMEISGGGEVYHTSCYVEPLQGVRISYWDGSVAQGLDYGEMIYPSEINWSDQELLYLFVETIDWYYCSWEWYLNDGYLAAQIPKENDTLYAWVYINFETGFCVDLLEIDSHTCWKNCSNTLNLNDSVISYLNDTVLLDAGPGYDSYLWSTGDSNQMIEIICSEWGTGQWQIIVEAVEEPCHYFDTIYVKIEDIVGIPSNRISTFRIGPNPFINQLGIWNPSESVARFDVINILGNIVFSSDIPPGKHTLNLGSLKTGIYLGSLSNGEKRTVVKMMKQ